MEGEFNDPRRVLKDRQKEAGRDRKKEVQKYSEGFVFTSLMLQTLDCYQDIWSTARKMSLPKQKLTHKQ
jgi:hypothetical protein